LLPIGCRIEFLGGGWFLSNGIPLLPNSSNILLLEEAKVVTRLL
jgi:hypothetical protein